jgi:hypothetical protein
MQNTVVQQVSPFQGTTTLAPLSAQVQLQAGEIFTASASPSPSGGYTFGFNLKVTGPAGQTVASQVGTPTVNPAVDFKAPATGTYTFTVSDVVPIAGSAYPTLTLRPIELHTGALDPAGSAADAALFSYAGGGLYAWLNSQDQLTLSGPTGIGFTIPGQWSESVSGSTITYEDSNDRSVSFGGGTAYSLAPGVALTVTAQANDASNHFGQVTGEALDLLGTSLGSLIGPLGQLAGMSSFSFPGGGASLPQVSVGIGLGGSLGVQATALPADPAVPYLYASFSTGVNLRFGGASVVSSSVYHVGVAIDPVDRSYGIDIQGIPVLNEVAVEASEYATIPYAPQAAPEQWGGAFYGDVYFKGTIDVSALTGGELPVAASTSITANLDPNHVGLSAAMSQTLQSFLQGQMGPSAAMHYLESIAVGLNGEVDLTLPGGTSLATIVLPAAEASVIYYGPTQTLYMHADSMNPFANTPIASYLPYSTTSFDGTIDFANGQFRFTAEEGFSFAGASVDAGLTLSNSGVVLAFDTTLSEHVSLGSLNATFNAQMNNVLSIQFASNGDVSFTLDVTGSATASCSVGSVSKSWSSPTLSYSWWGNADLSYLESQTASDKQYILNDVAKSVEAWLKTLESEGKSIWQKISGWFKSHF